MVEQMTMKNKNELVLAQNQHAFLQDDTKGIVQVIVGPYKLGLTTSDIPVQFNPHENRFFASSVDDAIKQNPVVPEDSYVVLENPTKEEGKFPASGSQPPATLQAGRKINIPGPITFALWPGQVATVVEGHQLKSNEYIFIRVYNVEEADKNWPKDALKKPDTLVVGQLLSIKGTDVSFFIPPTGMEVVKDPNTGKFVRLAVTLEQLEYCILLNENGTKRYEYGPKVVFPEPTEKFVSRKKESATAQGEALEAGLALTKFKAIELNDQMGLYIKVITDYTEDDGTLRKVGEELFIKGTDCRIYYPRHEHAVIEYASTGNFKRQRHYGVTIPKGEGRYVLNKDEGKIETVKGETIFVPDPRNQVLVRRVLDPKMVALMYPGNQEAIDYNVNLSKLSEGGSQNYVSYSTLDVANAAGALDLSRSINRNTSKSVNSQQQSFEGAIMKRGTTYTPPPMLTLDTKYEGCPVVNVWTGYAVQVLDKTGNRRVVKGPATILLEYDETLEKLTLSSGNPKTADNLKNDVYLRVDHNKVSDTVEVETKDMVTANIKVSYRVNFEGDSQKWFAVENYVKFLCDHVRSILRGVVKKVSIKELIDNHSSIVRDVVLGPKESGKDSKGRLGMRFEENNMVIYDVEVLSLKIKDEQVSNMIHSSQQKAVQDSLLLTAKMQELENAKVLQKIEQELAELNNNTVLRKVELEKQKSMAISEAAIAKANEETKLNQLRQEAALMIEGLVSDQAAEVLSRRKAEEEQNLLVAKAETALFVDKMQSINPALTSAIQTLANNHMVEELSKAVAPIALIQNQGIDSVIKRLIPSTSALHESLTTVIREPLEE